MSPTCGPLWLLLLVGWLLGACLGHAGGARPAAAAPGSLASAGGRAARTPREAWGGCVLARWTVRELRQLPGIGPARAVAVARARWAHRFPRAATARDPRAAAGPDALRRGEAGPPGGGEVAATARSGDGEVTRPRSRARASPGGDRDPAPSASGTGGALLLDDVRGIGPATSAAVAAWLRARGFPRGCPALVGPCESLATGPDPPPDLPPGQGPAASLRSWPEPRPGGWPRGSSGSGSGGGRPGDATAVELVCRHGPAAGTAGSGPGRGSVHSPRLPGGPP